MISADNILCRAKNNTKDTVIGYYMKIDNKSYIFKKEKK